MTTATEKKPTVIKGQVHTMQVGENSRSFMNLTLKFGDVMNIAKPNRFNERGSGSQRALIPSHSNRIKKAILNGNFTPTSFSGNLSKKQLEEWFSVDKEGNATLTIPVGKSVDLSDAQHREDAFSNIYAEAIKEKDEVKAKQILDVPIPFLLYVDGDPKHDFLNLQEGKPADKTHVKSLRIRAGLLDPKKAPYIEFADDVARIMNTNKESPFYALIQFTTMVKRPFPFQTLCAEGSSDLSTSLYGMAKVALAEGHVLKKESCAYMVTAAFEALSKHANAVIGEGKYLAEPGIASKGAATMWIGIANCLAYRCRIQGLDIPEEADLKALVRAAKKTLNASPQGRFSGGDKRDLMGAFAAEFFDDMGSVVKHEGVPIELCQWLSCSTFGLEPLPKVLSVDHLAPDITDEEDTKV